MHPAAKLQFRRIVDEYARWPRDQGRRAAAAPGMVVGTGVRIAEYRSDPAGRLGRRLGLADGATYAAGAGILLKSLADRPISRGRTISRAR